ncbi:MAG TPA: signal recognition particle-docking protein FtsY [Planctomycetes bacterium]|nr:signal recognition particle-docking protein FtsY [Planctomycetota bacterium]
MAFGNLFGHKNKDQEKEKKGGSFSALRRGLSKTREKLTNLFSFGRKLDENLLEEIESALIGSDFGPATAIDLCDQLRDAYRGKEFDSEEAIPFLKKRLTERLAGDNGIDWAAEGTTVIVVAGVNGTGKTTSIAKLANLFTGEGKSVLLAAADTFRAAAVEQLAIWSERLGVELVRGKKGGDPASVVFDAVEQALDEKVDVLIIDTAGRLHTEKNLMEQLAKIGRVIEKKYPGAPHEVLQVLDATTGQNAVAQAKEFNKAMAVTGLVLTKLDGTARGGVIFPILEEVGLPVKYIGVGEGLDDLQPFDPASFVDALFE